MKEESDFWVSWTTFRWQIGSLSPISLSYDYTIMFFLIVIIKVCCKPCTAPGLVIVKFSVNQIIYNLTVGKSKSLCRCCIWYTHFENGDII